MRKTYWLIPVFTALLELASSAPVKAQEKITLYAPLKYQHDQSRAFFDFQLRAFARRGADWDVGYGLLYAGDDYDWFQSSGARNNRSVIKDLGNYSWSDSFTVPVVEPLAKLKPGEQRQVSIDTSGADGADGAPGAPGKPGADADGVVRQRAPTTEAAVSADGSSRPKRDGKPKIDPLFVKAVLGHMYVIHVVDDKRDFYALFRVEALERGDYCTISWKLIPSPVAQ